MNNLVEYLKSAIEKRINEEYTNYKEKTLRDLNKELEFKRNNVVKNVLDEIEIVMQQNQPHSLEPIIQIRINKVVKV